MGLNHMNGRVEDSVTGRFLSADRFIPDPTDSQSYNRYSYVVNNPLSYIDPSGFCGLPVGPDGTDGEICEVTVIGTPPAPPTESQWIPFPIPYQLVGPQGPNGNIGDGSGGGGGSGSSTPPPAAPPPKAPPPGKQTWTWKQIQNWLCRGGNTLESGADKLGDAGFEVELAGAAVTASSLLALEAPPIAGALASGGTAAMATGGMLTLGASGIQAVGGVAQMIGGDLNAGWHNVLYGTITFGTGYAVSKAGGWIQSAGANGNQRLFNSQVQAGAAAAGATNDFVNSIVPDASPAEAECD